MLASLASFTPLDLARAALWIALTLAAYRLATALHVRARQHPLSNAVVVAIVLLAPILIASHTPYADYAACVRPISLVLGPATVALALPLYRSLDTIRSAARPVAAGTFAGAVVACVSAVAIGRALGASRVTVRSLAPKSVTTPIAMAIATRVGGDASRASVFVLVTGMIGAMVVPGLFRLVRIDDPRARGLAIGLAAHGIGTARALVLGSTEGGFSAVGMSLSALFTPVVVPLVLAFVDSAR